MPTGGPFVQVQNWGDAVFASITNTLYTLLGAIPLIIGALVILIIGWLLSNALAGLTGRLPKCEYRTYLEEVVAEAKRLQQSR